jgi:serine/threonine protein kinase
MSYCCNPQCNHPQNAGYTSQCLHCGFSLLLQNRYRLLKLIDYGSFGRTFLAVDECGEQVLCVAQQCFSQPPGIYRPLIPADVFQQEIIRLAELGNHPQIPSLLDAFEQDGHRYLIQEWVAGQTLEQELADGGAFSESEIRQVLIALLPIVRFIHSHQIIHQDIKPANIIRRSHDGQLVLVGFGSARWIAH